MTLTLQIHHHGQWHDAAELTFSDPESGRRAAVSLGYCSRYAIDWMARDDEHACSLNMPVELMMRYEQDHWLALLDDIMPAGASRRYWIRQLGIEALPAYQQDYQLLARGTVAPVGNLRIKESLPPVMPGSQLTQRRFRLQEVIDRHTDFLEYAQQMGAAAGGATGAGGEAPKLVLRRSLDDEIWIDSWQDDATNTDAHYLVKFPRNRRNSIDCDILRAEYHYYHELAALGIDTIDTRGMQLIEGARYPSLWLPRFDVAFHDGQRTLYGLESIYSLLERPPGTFLRHTEVIATLIDRLHHQYRVRERGETFDPAALVIEWVRRDLLNVVFGNSDNHGRNSALLKRPSGIELAPVYDFAPMKADPEGIIRTLQWGAPLEEGGRYDWHAIAQALAQWVAPDRLLVELGALADNLKGLKTRLARRGVPDTIVQLPSLGFDYLDERLERWELP